MKNTDSLTAKQRIASWWVRLPDLNWPNVDAHDKIKRRAEAMYKANVTTAMIFGAHFRWDFLPYFTLLHDYLATVAEELRAYGLQLYDHHSVNLVHRYDTAEEMRHVMLHSGPHLPLSPSREAAASWEYKGSRLNDWRMIDVKTRDVLYLPQYAAEGFCIRNPAFVEAYRTYLSTLIADTGIKGVSADDPVHYMHYNSCACAYCRAALKERTGVTLPAYDDRGFWGNWENPAWNAWIDLRFEAASEFFNALRPVLPEGFRMTTCGSNSASAGANGKASDARAFLSGCNYVNLEMSGNTPPYYPDPVTNNASITDHIVSASHHRAAAREKGVRCFATGFGFTETTANVVWAVNKMLDADAWISTLKDRLGLPDHILATLPEEADIVGNAFGFEAAHPELFRGTQIFRVGVYFSYETRMHTCFGNLDLGYYRDFSATLRTLFGAGLDPATLFAFPRDTKEFPVVVLSSAARMTASEQDALDAYLACGGTVIVTGPSALPDCNSAWVLPTHPTLDRPEDFFSTVVHGVKHQAAEWIRKTALPPYEEHAKWREVRPGLFYHPRRISDGDIAESVTATCRARVRPMPVGLKNAEGYLLTTFETEDAILLHLLAKEFDTDIDHRLDEMRFHRSRVNLITKAVPIGQSDTFTAVSDTPPTVHLPFSKDTATVTPSPEGFTVRLPKDTAYAILAFPKKA